MPELPPPVPKRRSYWAPVLIGLVVILLAVIGVIWWNNRPIKPVQLTAEEKAAVGAKVEAIQNVEAPAAPAEPQYEKGTKEITLTERELNGLLTYDRRVMKPDVERVRAAQRDLIRDASRARPAGCPATE